MKTRNQIKKVTPEVIQIDSEISSSSHFRSDDSSCSQAQNSSCSSVESDSQPFMNLLPDNEKKSQKQRMQHLKSYLFEKKQSTNEILIQRAPILNLLRPVTQNLKGQQKTKQRIVQSQGEESIVFSIQPPPLEESDQQIKQLSQPRKKPKLMDQLQKHLNIPASQYVIDGAGKQLRQQRRRENKRRDYLIDKKMKQYRVGKKKDNVSNQVFNAIEDIFG